MHNDASSNVAPRNFLTTLLSKHEAHRNHERGLHRFAAASRRVECHALGRVDVGFVEAVAEARDDACAEHLAGFIQRYFDTHAPFDAGSARVVRISRFDEALRLGLHEIFRTVVAGNRRALSGGTEHLLFCLRLHARGRRTTAGRNGGGAAAGAGLGGAARCVGCCSKSFGASIGFGGSGGLGFDFGFGGATITATVCFSGSGFFIALRPPNAAICTVIVAAAAPMYASWTRAMAQFCSSTLMANLVIPSSFAKSMTCTTLPWGTSLSALTIRFKSLLPASADLKWLIRSGSLIGSWL